MYKTFDNLGQFKTFNFKGSIKLIKIDIVQKEIDFARHLLDCKIFFPNSIEN